MVDTKSAIASNAGFALRPVTTKCIVEGRCWIASMTSAREGHHRLETW